MQEPTVTTDIQLIKGVSNFLFSGEGMFLATLTGPGRIWLQSMPLMNLAEALAPYLPMAGAKTNINSTTGAIGGLLGLAAMVTNNDQ